jgi:hypothetical protein
MSLTHTSDMHRSLIAPELGHDLAMGGIAGR